MPGGRAGLGKRLHRSSSGAEDNTIIGASWLSCVPASSSCEVLFYNSSGEKLGNGEQYIKWRLTDLAKPEPHHITVPLGFKLAFCAPSEASQVAGVPALAQACEHGAERCHLGHY